MDDYKRAIEIAKTFTACISNLTFAQVVTRRNWGRSSWGNAYINLFPCNLKLESFIEEEFLNKCVDQDLPERKTSIEIPSALEFLSGYREARKKLHKLIVEKGYSSQRADAIIEIIYRLDKSSFGQIQ